MRYLKYFFATVGILVCLPIALITLLIVTAVIKSDGSKTSFDFAKKITSEHAVAVVELTGEIMNSEKFVKQLGKQIEDSKIKGIVVKIDSPGGAVGASEEIYRAIKEASATKPVVCSLSNIAASGGLMAAMGCQKVIANESTLTGSIGVIMMSPNFKSLMEMVGFQMMVVKSGKLKDAGSPFREMTEEDKNFLQSIIDKSYDQFVRMVAESRKLDINKVKEFADGRVILGSEAVKLGLIDGIGGVKQAAKIALELINDNAEPEIIMPKKKSNFELFFEEMPDSKIAFIFRSLTQPMLLYRVM